MGILGEGELGFDMDVLDVLQPDGGADPRITRGLDGKGNAVVMAELILDDGSDRAS